MVAGFVLPAQPRVKRCRATHDGQRDAILRQTVTQPFPSHISARRPPRIKGRVQVSQARSLALTVPSGIPRTSILCLTTAESNPRTTDSCDPACVLACKPIARRSVGPQPRRSIAQHTTEKWTCCCRRRHGSCGGNASLRLRQNEQGLAPFLGQGGRRRGGA